jgi:hypothetical protein
MLMRRRPLLLATIAVAALATLLFVSLAAAASPTKETDPFTDLVNCVGGICTDSYTDASGTTTTTFPAYCDFDLLKEVSGVDNVTLFSDGRIQVHETLSITHTNLDTSPPYAVTERDQLNFTINPDGSGNEVGVFWHLRDPSGKIVAVHAGRLVFDSSGNLVKFTPNTNPDAAAVICPALGGHALP